jgi:nitroimidazol reductase NimA-like FMN-containing flavoprotein (pyridoxamine 5'-phosphate oxidase superfamily)/predicted kinase
MPDRPHMSARGQLNILKARHVRPRHDEEMSGRNGVQGHEDHDGLVLEHRAGVGLTGDDGAEDAFVRRRCCMLCHGVAHRTVRAQREDRRQDRFSGDLCQHVWMALVGSTCTRLVILRGDSASGKTTTAIALREKLGPRVALISQDYIRRELLHNVDPGRRSQDASLLIVAAARLALDLGYDVVLDGIFNLRDYSEPFELLHREHRGITRIYQFDVGLDETLRRHADRPLSSVVSEEKIREWYDGWQPLPWYEERRVGADTTSVDLVASILRDCNLHSPEGEGLSNRGPGYSRRMDTVAIADQLIAENAYLTLATVDERGAPWSTPVWFAPDGRTGFVWASKPGARHSLNLTTNPLVAISIFDSSRPPGDGSAVYAAARAEEVDERGRDVALAIYNARSAERGLPEWSLEQLSGDARHRLYRATVTEMYVLDDHDERIIVPDTPPPAS